MSRQEVKRTKLQSQRGGKGKRARNGGRLGRECTRGSIEMGSSMAEGSTEKGTGTSTEESSRKGCSKAMASTTMRLEKSTSGR